MTDGEADGGVVVVDGPAARRERKAMDHAVIVRVGARPGKAEVILGALLPGSGRRSQAY
jgi:hypothetical protein